jgi:hypothetical protein
MPPGLSGRSHQAPDAGPTAKRAKTDLSRDYFIQMAQAETLVYKSAIQKDYPFMVQAETVADFGTLPEDVIDQVVGKCNVKDIPAVMLLNRRFKSRVNETFVKMKLYGEMSQDKLRGLWIRAVESDDVTTVASLLQTGRIDPGENDSYALRIAAKSGSLQVVRRLLKDSRVDPAADGNDALGKAVEKAQIGVAVLLVQDPRVDPQADDNFAMRMAAEKGHPELMKALLKDGRADPANNNDYAIKLAATKGYFDILLMLLADGRADPASEENYALRMARQNKHETIAAVLQAYLNGAINLALVREYISC